MSVQSSQSSQSSQPSDAAFTTDYNKWIASSLSESRERERASRRKLDRWIGSSKQ